MNGADLLEQLAIAEARQSFWAYRQYINRDQKKAMKLGWWQRSIAYTLQTFYDDLIDGRRPKLVIQAPPQHGKQIADETPVLTTKGWKNHGDLKIGDMVFHSSGKPVNVVAVSEKTPSTMKVTFSNGEVIFCHPRHEWTVFNRNKKRFETIETLKMLKSGKRSKDRNPLYTGTKGARGCHYVYKLPNVQPLQGEPKELPADPYMLGVWLGDGSQNGPVVTHDKKDSAIIDALITHGFTPSTSGSHPKTGVVTTRFGGTSMTTQLKAAGVFTRQAGERKKHIPSIYLTAPIKDRLDLLAGLIDTDGYVYQKNGRAVFTTADIRLKDTFCELLSTFGWTYSVVTEKPKLSSSGIQGKKEYYAVGFTPDLEIPCALERKRNTPAIKNRMVSITDIQICDEGKMGHCIQVDAPDGLYLVGKTMIPTHNSHQIIDFCSWVAGKNPDFRTIYTSFSERLGVRANLRLQKIFDSKKFKICFPDCKINSKETAQSYGRAVRNKDLIEFVSHDGYFRNTTVRGSITGESLDLGVIDDPIKGREEAGSLTIRDKTWDWLMDDFFSRFSEDAGMLAILTRWHVDDPIGRLIALMPDIKVVSYPALATANAKLMPDDPRPVGSEEPLFPEHKSKDFLLERKAVYHASSWEALYQQNPIIVGGEIIKGREFVRYTIHPVIKFRFIYADTAQKTKERNDYSVFECWGMGDDGKIYLLDLLRGKWESYELKKRAVDFWNKHSAAKGLGTLRQMKVEDKASGTGLIQDIRRNDNIPIVGIERSKDKLTRVLDVVSYITAGKVCIPEAADWVNDFISECEAFTADDSHSHDDQVDPMCDAISDMLAAKPKGFFS